MSNNFRLLPEWAPQEAVLLVWPDDKTDWQPWLNEVQDVYLQLIAQLNQSNTAVVLLVRENQLEIVKQRLENRSQVLLVKADFNDTWIRDFAFLTCSDGANLQPIDFRFNGWGQKFNADKDNTINQDVLAKLCQQPIKSVELVLEGGAVEVDQYGQLLSTHMCLTNLKRNGSKTIESYQQDFALHLGVDKSIILQNGHLQGDDTDGHIDTLVRFTPHQGLVLQSAFNQPSDQHFEPLTALVTECQAAFPDSTIFELPLPKIYNDRGERLPASYANFLISNQHVLCPIYQQAEDQLAIQVIQKAFPDFTVVPINCLPLIQQFGSLHCITMQIPCGVFKPEILQLVANGVQQYDA